MAPKLERIPKSEIGNLIPIPILLIKEIYFIVFYYISKTDPDCWKSFLTKNNRINVEGFLIHYLGTDPRSWTSELPREKYFFSGIDSKGNFNPLLTKKQEWVIGIPKRAPKIVAEDFISYFRAFRSSTIILTGYEHIKDCLVQYNNPPHFLFGGFILPNKLYNPDEFRLPKPIPFVNNLAFVLGTDYTASHWIALFLNFKKGFNPETQKETTILHSEYFDSFGNSISSSLIKSISELYGVIKSKFRHFDGTPITKRSNVKLQKSGLDCGVYAVHYIVTRLLHSKVSLENFLDQDVPDDEFIKKCKSYYWNIYKPDLEDIKD